MKVEYKISEKEFVKLNFYLLYRRPIIILMGILCLIILYFCLRYYFKYHQPVTEMLGSIFLLAYFIAFMPVIYYFRFKRSFKSNNAISQRTVSEIDENYIIDITETSKVKTTWDNVYRVEELNSWFLLYFSKTSFGFLPKRVLQKNEVEELRGIILSTGINAKLKSN